MAVRSRRPHPRITILLAVLATLLVAVPVTVFASHQFSDVPDANPFHGDIDVLADSGVTSGCGGGKFCPSSNVTREQMAAFLNRLGALAPNKTPVVNADKVDGYSSADLTRVAFTIANPLVTAGSGTLSRGIAVPKAGYLVISANAQVVLVTGSKQGIATCKLQVDNVDVPNSYMQTSVNFTAGVENLAQQCTTEAVVEACVPGDYLVDLEGTVNDSAIDITIATLRIEYVPFGNTGLPPACTSS